MRRVAVFALPLLVLILLGLVAWQVWPERASARPVAQAATKKAHPRSRPQGQRPAVERPPAAEAPAIATEPDPLPAEALRSAIYGRVKGAERLPEGAVVLEGCGLGPFDGTPVDADGSFFAEVDAGKCSLRAWRLQGALRLPGPWSEVDALAGGDVDVQIEVPAFEPAGMGITFQANGDAIGILDTRPGTPAAEAGLSHGDQILLIDGAATAGMSQEDFLQHGIGPAGSSVHLEGVTSEGEPFDVVMTRRPISLD